ncbi:hypothetical protein RRG08_064967 [Elysia crispata]|uniref:Uncharacterized protein n=1 Tax=Elysia crispata TaxID=231223 RepID=A0AAE0Y9Q2_9GAST|nr:hypothetical protein RRG08_064967 [Elysia crispata]
MVLISHKLKSISLKATKIRLHVREMYVQDTALGMDKEAADRGQKGGTGDYEDNVIHPFLFLPFPHLVASSQNSSRFISLLDRCNSGGISGSLGLADNRLEHDKISPCLVFTS